MGLFSKFRKGKNRSADQSPSNSGIFGSRGSINLIGVQIGYDINEKELNKIQKAIWKNDIGKLKSLVKKEVNSSDKENR